MKKILLLLGLVLLTGNWASAATSTCDHECVEPYDLNNKLRSAISIVTGLNALTENRVESILKKEIFKIGSADELKIKVNSYSSKDMKNGIFKSMKMSGKNVVINDVHFSSINLKTLCNFNYIKQSGNEIVFMEDMPLSFEISMSPDDINNTMAYTKYKKIIDSANKIVQSYGGGLSVDSAKVSIKNNKFYFIVAINLPLITKQPNIVVSADLRVKNGKIDYQNARITSGYIKLDLKKFDFIIDYLNPLDFSINFMQDKNAKFKVKNIDIKDNMIYADGIIIIPKD